MTIQNILIAIEFSSCSEDVTRRGADLARQLGARPILLHVVPPQDVPLDTVLPLVEGSAAKGITVEAYLRESAERRLLRYVELLGEHAQEPRVVVRFGAPAETIVDEASRSDAGMIVMGTRGRTGIARAVLGSVADEVHRLATVPVMAIRSEWHAGCAVKSCNWCMDHVTPEEQRVADERCG